MKRWLFILSFLLLYPAVHAQQDSTKTSWSFSGDFRFRVEQDWDSRKSDDTYRDDRSRLRYRLRLGATYQYSDWLKVGARLRTSQENKQQDPHLTLGDGFKEFSTLPIAFEKVYVQFKYKSFTTWLGKNTFPFEKRNELFWSDNVFPEGIAVSGYFQLDNSFLQSLKINTGHFIVAANGQSFDGDSYFHGLQLVTTHFKNRLTLFPAVYYFNDLPDIPDGGDTFSLDYTIVHLGTALNIWEDKGLKAEIDYYRNVTSYDSNNNIPEALQDQKEGIVLSTSFGTLKQKGDWKIRLTYAYLERYAAVDYFAQNDWVRWDYSSHDSPDGRLTNFKGFEVMAGYTLNPAMNLKMRFFTVEQLIPYGTTKENGNRVRLDLNISF